MKIPDISIFIHTEVTWFHCHRALTHKTQEDAWSYHYIPLVVDYLRQRRQTLEFNSACLWFNMCHPIITQSPWQENSALPGNQTPITGIANNNKCTSSAASSHVYHLKSWLPCNVWPLKHNDLENPCSWCLTCSSNQKVDTVLSEQLCINFTNLFITFFLLLICNTAALLTSV